MEVVAWAEVLGAWAVEKVAMAVWEGGAVVAVAEEEVGVWVVEKVVVARVVMAVWEGGAVAAVAEEEMGVWVVEKVVVAWVVGAVAAVGQGEAVAAGVETVAAALEGALGVDEGVERVGAFVVEMEGGVGADIACIKM